MARAGVWVVAVDNLGGSHRRGQVAGPEDFPAKGQWQRLVEIGAVRHETAEERDARERASGAPGGIAGRSEEEG
jgi:hypothetical protein